MWNREEGEETMTPMPTAPMWDRMITSTRVRGPGRQ